jgi:hypothetical protein
MRIITAGMLTVVPPLTVVMFFVLSDLVILGFVPGWLVPFIWVVLPSVGVLAGLAALALSAVELSHRVHIGALVVVVVAMAEIASIILIGKRILTVG